MKNLLFVLLIAFVSCKKDKSELPPAPDPFVSVTSAQKICIGINCTQIRVNYSISNSANVQAAVWVDGNGTYPLTVAPSGTFTVLGVTAQTGNFRVTTKEGKVINQVTQIIKP